MAEAEKPKIERTPQQAELNEQGSQPENREAVETGRVPEVPVADRKSADVEKLEAAKEVIESHGSGNASVPEIPSRTTYGATELAALLNNTVDQDSLRIGVGNPELPKIVEEILNASEDYKKSTQNPELK